MRGLFVVVVFTSIVFLLIPLIVGIYVYRDAQNRNMNALLWALVAALAPTYIGLIVYLIVRSDYDILNCSACNSPVEKHYSTCPNCGVYLKAICETCNHPLQPHWKVCPECSTQISHMYRVQTPIKRSDTSLFKLLVFVFLAPILFVVLAIISFYMYRMI